MWVLKNNKDKAPVLVGYYVGTKFTCIFEEETVGDAFTMVNLLNGGDGTGAVTEGALQLYKQWKSKGY